MKSQFTIDILTPLFQKYIDILNVIESEMDSSNVAYISQTEIGKRVSLSPTNVSQRLRQLIKYGSIEQCAPATYKMIHNDLWHSPFKIVNEVYYLVRENPEIKRNYKEQAAKLNVPIVKIYQAWGYLNSIDE